ncbi:MAG: AbrB family transcriptional regulator [Sedimentitalea sp.]|nr:AbrB family transcriptional regulator [Sedimentitalea sp.]
MSGPAAPTLAMTLLSLAIGALGAAAAWRLGAPAWVLTGPALAVTLAALAGLRLGVVPLMRDACLLVLGLGIGAGVDAEAGAAVLRWPLAFAVLSLTVFATLHACRLALERGFRFDRRSAVLAAAPGHLSFVLSMAADMDCDVARVAVVQSIRLLALTLAVPFVALAMGYDMAGVAMGGGAPMAAGPLALLTLAALAAGAVFRRLGLPAPLLLGAMAVSAGGHVSGLSPGAVPQAIMIPAFLVLGTLIGTRFAGMPQAQFFGSLAAGLAVTVIAVAMAGAAAVPVARALGMPAPHVLTAFAPGGLETMVALGATMGASPGFVAACHVARLLVLSLLIPLSLGRSGARS